MTLFFSGEGPTDLGRIEWDGAQLAFRPGPMGEILLQFCRRELDWWPAAPEQIRFVSKPDLEAARPRNGLQLPRAGRGIGTGYHYRSALLLGMLAIDAEGVDSIAVLFRDCDGTRITPRDDWQSKFDSIDKGFQAAGFANGVPMLPLPKSEAWLLCGLRPDLSVPCDALEDAPGNDASPNSLKARLEAHFGRTLSADEQAELVANGEVSLELIAMPSFCAFRDRLLAVLARYS